MKDGNALVLLSGGLDSTTAMAIAASNCVALRAVSFQYGQSHSREIESARAIAKYYHAHHEVIVLPDIFKGFGSTLTDKQEQQPHMTYEEMEKHEGPMPTYVPYRNGNFLSVAATIALVNDFTYIYWGPHAGDAHHWAYPDCTPEFTGAMSNAIYIGTDKKVRLVTPLQWLSKIEVVKLGIVLKAPFHLTWSCYEGGEAQCGECPTCLDRIRAFNANDAIDPVAYLKTITWKAKQTYRIPQLGE